jgi:hypothetical protein
LKLPLDCRCLEESIHKIRPCMLHWYFEINTCNQTMHSYLKHANIAFICTSSNGVQVDFTRETCQCPENTPNNPITIDSMLELRVFDPQIPLVSFCGNIGKQIFQFHISVSISWISNSCSRHNITNLRDVTEYNGLNLVFDIHHSTHCL